jgi:hypothetical protein
MKSKVIAIMAAVFMVSLIPAMSFALVPYSQDFEGLNQASVTALGDDGWLVFANVFGPDWGYWYGYGVFPAPNDGGGFCQIALAEGGAAQGAQQLVVFSDYNNVDHANNAYIESNVFQEQAIEAGDVGVTWIFDFQAKMGNLELDSTALAFIKTLDPNNGYATTNFITLDMTAIDTTWNDYSISIAIDGSLEGQLLQIGFSNTATLYQGSGVFYDNIEFHQEGAVATDSITLDGVKSLYR